jgi:phosphatidylserine/phosphatidylglycerophosphate/cardiolipin synthase-like enzyme
MRTIRTAPQVVGTATVQQLAILEYFGVPNERCKYYDERYAEKRISALIKSRSNGSTSRVSIRRKKKSAAKSAAKVVLLDDAIWPRITALAQASPNSCVAAIAFLGEAAPRLLPLKRGSLIVTNFGEDAIKRGLTSPRAILRLLANEVDVHSDENLHAKVFVVPTSAVVGSMNASRHSEQICVEAAIEVTDQQVVRRCKRFVRRLAGKQLTPEYVRSMIPLYRSLADLGGTDISERRAPTERTWVVRVTDPWDKYDHKAYQAGKPKAEQKLSSAERYEVDEFCFVGGGIFQRDVSEQLDFVIQIESDKGELVAHPPSRVIHLERYGDPGGESRIMVFC